MADYKQKKIRSIIETFEELDEASQDEVLDKIKYDGALQAALDVGKTKTVTFGERYDYTKDRQQFFNNYEGIATGLKYFDEATMGLRPGELIVVAGPSNVGKTMIALNMVASAAENALKKVLIISMEMTSDEIFSRMYNITNNHDAVKQNILVQNNLTVTPAHIKAIIQRDKPDVVMIDHLQFVANTVKGGSEYERIGQAISKLKSIAIKEMVPIVLISHVAKTRTGGDGKAGNGDLKGASNIEQDADIVIMLNRDMDRIGESIICTLTKHRTKFPKIFLKDCGIDLEGIKVANDGTYWLSS